MQKKLNRFCHFLSSANLWTIAFLFLVLLYILPIWIFKYFPSTDGPCHIYNSFILKHYNDPNYKFNEFYGIRKALVPNWASHAFMMLFMYVVPPLIAEKLLLTIYVILMAGGILYLLNAVERGRTPLAFLGFPFIYYHLLLMGFYNNSLSIALLILSIGYWWKHFSSFGVKNAVILGSLLVMLYFCHLIGLIMALFSIAAIGIFGLLPKFRKWKQSLLGLLSTLPSIGLTLYYFSIRGANHSGSGELHHLWRYFIWNETLAYYSQSQLIIAKFVTGIFVILFFYTLIRDHFFTKEWYFNFGIRKKDFFLLLCAVFFAIYVLAPDGMSGGWGIKGRLCYLPFLIIIPWLSWDMPKIARGIVGVAIMLLSAIYLIHGSYYHKVLSDQVKIFVSGSDVVERNKVIMPMSFGSNAGAWRIGPIFHAAGHYGYKRGSIEVFNYEAGLVDYFPTYFKSSFKPGLHRPPSNQEGNPRAVDIGKYANNIDYIITWDLEPGSDMEDQILGYYELVKHNKSLKIFKQRKQKQEAIKPITDKTLVAWVSISNLNQRGSGILTLERFDIFDSIVFGEVRPRTWMAGSDVFTRTQQNQSDWQMETAEPDELIQIAIVYRGKQVSLYRNGKMLAFYNINQPFTFRSGMKVLLGLRHQAVSGSANGHFAGSVEEARLYDSALDPETIASLEPNQISSIKPLAMWTFEDGTTKDEMGFFRDGEIRGGATIRNGKLMLDGKDAYMVTPPKYGQFYRGAQ